MQVQVQCQTSPGCSCPGRAAKFGVLPVPLLPLPKVSFTHPATTISVLPCWVRPSMMPPVCVLLPYTRQTCARVAKKPEAKPHTSIIRAGCNLGHPHKAPFLARHLVQQVISLALNPHHLVRPQHVAVDGRGAHGWRYAVDINLVQLPKPLHNAGYLGAPLRHLQRSHSRQQAWVTHGSVMAARDTENKRAERAHTIARPAH